MGAASCSTNMSDQTFDAISSTDSHKKSPALKTHNLQNVRLGNQTDNQRVTLPKCPTERCGEHHDKVLDMYCETHDVVGCSTCISEDHRSCPDNQIYSVPVMVDKLFNLTNSKQAQRNLNNRVISIVAFSDSIDTQLAKLIEDKNEALRKITNFQKALEAAIKRAAEVTKKELEDMYKKLEEEVLQDKTEVKSIEALLCNTIDKIKKAKGNHVQCFVLTKLAETQMKEAGDKMIKLKKNTITDIHISFTPSQPLMDYINGKHGIGEVVGPTKKRTDQTVREYGARGASAVVSPTKKKSVMEHGDMVAGAVVSPTKKRTDQTAMKYGARGTGALVSPTKKTTDQTAMEYGTRGTGAVVSPSKKKTDQTIMEYGARGTSAVVSRTKKKSVMEHGDMVAGAVVSPTKKTTDQTAMEYGTRGTGAVVSPSKKKTDQTVMEYGARGTGAVVSLTKKRTDQTPMEFGAGGIDDAVSPTKERTELYKVKGSTDINIKLPEDSSDCCSMGCCLTPDKNQLLLTEYKNQKLIRFDVKKIAIIDHCHLDGIPYGVCCVGTREAVVACGFPRMIQFVSIDKKMTPTRQIKMTHNCFGIATKDNKLYITDFGSSVYIYDMLGKLLKTISPQDSAGNKLFDKSRYITFNDSGNMYVSCRSNGIVCLDNAGNYVSTYNDNDLKGTDGLCVDGRKNLFVVGFYSHNVLQFNENGEKVGVVIKEQDEIQHPRSICFNQKLNRLFLSMGSNVLKMYELE